MIGIKKHIQYGIVAILFLNIGCNGSDKLEKLPFDYEFIIEGGNQNRVMRNNSTIIDSGLVDYKYSNNYIVFSVDTTYSMNPKKIDKNELVYYFHDLKRDTLFEKISYKEFKKIVDEISLKELDISK